MAMASARLCIRRGIGVVSVAAAQDRERPELIEGLFGEHEALFDGAAAVGLHANQRGRLEASGQRQDQERGEAESQYAHMKKMTQKRRRTGRKAGLVPLARALSKLGLLSRSQAIAAILDGRVSVGGRVEANPAALVAPEHTQL